MTGAQLRTYLLTHNDREAAEAMGCDINVIYKFRKALNIQSRRERVHQARVSIMVDAISGGKSYKDALQVIGMQHSGRASKMWQKARELNGFETQQVQCEEDN